MIPPNIAREHVLQALEMIDSEGEPPGSKSRTYVLRHKQREYSPKLVVSLANKVANGEELDRSTFNGGKETNSFLVRLGFEIGSREPPTQSPHNERCPECKRRVEEMLRKIYGDVQSNHSLGVPAKLEAHSGSDVYRQLEQIHQALEAHRGHRGFVRADRLPPCDFFVPDPGFVVEFDESQHFTVPRRLALQHYVPETQLGFPASKWIRLCEQIQARDNDPVDRDERRAWYDSLRDFLPSIEGDLLPTVRLYSKDEKWCDLSVDSEEDVESFRRRIEAWSDPPSGHSTDREEDVEPFERGIEVGPDASRTRIATVCLRSDGYPGNDRRMDSLRGIIHCLADQISGDCVILFPAGWFSSDDSARGLYSWVEDGVRDAIAKMAGNVVVCVGVDGRFQRLDGRLASYARAQMALAIDSRGIEAIARKFYPAPPEKGHIDLASDADATEDGKKRVFGLGGRTCFMCVCYDCFGLRKSNVRNSVGADIVLDCVHGFYPKGSGASGDTYFARHGLAGASKQWGCPVFAAAVFFERDIPPLWPTGVYWVLGDISTQRWRYTDNPLVPMERLTLPTTEGHALLSIYDLEPPRRV